MKMYETKENGDEVAWVGQRWWRGVVDGGEGEEGEKALMWC